MWDEITYLFPNFNGMPFKMGMDKWFHLTFYNGCNYLSMLRLNMLKLIHVSERDPYILAPNGGKSPSLIVLTKMSLRHFVQNIFGYSCRISFGPDHVSSFKMSSEIQRNLQAFRLLTKNWNQIIGTSFYFMKGKPKLMKGHISFTVHHWGDCFSYIQGPKLFPEPLLINAFGPSDAIWRQRYGSTLAQVMACCLTAPSHYLNQCWLIISKI